MSVSTPFDNENIYDLAIRLYGNIAGITGLLQGVTSLDNPITTAIEFDPIVFTDYVAPEQPTIRKPDLVYTVGEGQSIYDLALQLTGKVQGITDIIGNYSGLDEDLQGVTISIPRKDDILVDIFLANNYVFATKEDADVISNWILALGVWNDTGVWIDTEFWLD